MRVAIVADWMVGGGAELVVEELAKIYPDAPIYTSYCSPEWRARLGESRVRTGILQRRIFFKLRKYIPILRIWWFSRLRFKKFDLVISSSGAEAKGIRVPEGVRHVNYCHAPTHYYWQRYDEYIKHPGFGIFDPLARLGLRLLVGPLRRWDYRAAQRPDIMLANSTYTKEMIKKYYGRESTVVFPPVDTTSYLPPTTSHDKPRHGFIVVGRQTPYKRIDLAVEACTQLGLPLTVVGNGPDHERLVSIAGPSVTFRTDVDDHEKIRLLQTHAAFIFPNEDDFGISAVEAMAAGCPVIALRAGGALDTVKQGVSGEFFDRPTVVSLSSTLQNFDPSKYDSEKIADYVAQFSLESFRKSFAHSVGNDSL